MAKKKASKKKTAAKKTAARKTAKRTTHAPTRRASKKVVRKASKKVAPKTAKKSPSVRASAGKMVYYFGAKGTQGDSSMKELIGGKGANLADMTSIGLPVPPGFTITTETCAKYYQGGKRLPHGLMNEVHKHVSTLEKEAKKTFGDSDNPLLVSVRSGAAVSMPGMMDTILNLGLNDESVEGLAQATGNRRFAYDAYRRLLNMFGDVVLGVDHHHFEHAFDELKRRYKVELDTDVPEDGIVELCERYKDVIKAPVAPGLPAEPLQAAGTGHRGRLQELERGPRDQLPAAQRHRRPAGHRRQCPVDGVRQHGRRTRARASPSRATPPPAGTSSTASFW